MIEFLDRKYIKLSIAGGVLVILAFLFFVMYSNYANLKSSLEAKQSTLAETEQSVANIASIRKEYEALLSETKGSPEILDKNKQEQYVLEKLQKLAESSGLIPQLIIPAGSSRSTTAAGAGFSEMGVGGAAAGYSGTSTQLKEFSVNLTLLGTQGSLESFLRTVEKDEPLIQFRTLSITQGTDTLAATIFNLSFATFYKE